MGHPDPRDRASVDSASTPSTTPSGSIGEKSRPHMAVDGSSLLRSIDRELAFYRERLYTTDFLILCVLVVGIFVQQAHHIEFRSPLVEAALFLAYFALMWFVAFGLRRSYVKRSNFLRARRSRLVADSTGEDPYTPPGGGEAAFGRFAWGPSVLILVLITILALVGAILALIGRE